jgi:cytochrome b6-f complex iron-sulfur subunit
VNSDSDQAESNEVIEEVRLKRYPLAIGIVLLSIATLVCVIAAIHQPSISRIKVGRVEDFPLGSMTPIQLTETFIDPNYHIHAVTVVITDAVILLGVTPMPTEQVTPLVFLVHDQTLGFLALYSRDPQGPGCQIKWVETNARFEDPCGGSKYTRTGDYIEGPTPRAMDRFEVIVNDNGEILVDVNEFELGLARALQ